MIGYYAHSHGSGHCNYARLIASGHVDECVIMTDCDYQFDAQMNIIHLENEHLTGEELSIEEFETPKYLHYAPAGLPKITRRNNTILKAVLEYHIKLLIIDVSVEVAALARVSSIPYAYIKMMGSRNDAAHLMAYQGAAFLIAYYPKSFESEKTPLWVQRKTWYLGFIAEIPAVNISAQTSLASEDYVLVIQGRGGNAMNDHFFESLSSYFSNMKVVVLGDITSDIPFSNIEFKGMVPDITEYIDAAKFIIAACGSNCTSEILSGNRKFMILAEHRPYDEQVEMSKALEKNSLGVLFDINDIAGSVSRYEALPDTIDKSYIPQDFSNFWQLLHKNNFKIEPIVDEIKNVFNKSTSIHAESLEFENMEIAEKSLI